MAGAADRISRKPQLLVEEESCPILGRGVEELTEGSPQPCLDEVSDHGGHVLGASFRLADVAERVYLAAGWIADEVEDADADRQVVPPSELRHAISNQLKARQPPAGGDSLVDDVAEHLHLVVKKPSKSLLDVPLVERGNIVCCASRCVSQENRYAVSVLTDSPSSVPTEIILLKRGSTAKLMGRTVRENAINLTAFLKNSFLMLRCVDDVSTSFVCPMDSALLLRSFDAVERGDSGWNFVW